MTEETARPATGTAPAVPLPDDDPSRNLTVISADDDGARHIGLAGDTYTVLVDGSDSAGRYCLIDMTIPPGGGPGPHRHDFEEMFTLLDGEVRFTFRGEVQTVHAGQTVNIPANAPHFFTNAAESTVRMLCLCAPAGQEEFFATVGDPVPTRTSPALPLAGDALTQRLALMKQLAPQYRTELLAP